MKQYLPACLVVIYSSKSTLYYTQYQASKYPRCTTFSTGNKASNFTKFFFKWIHIVRASVYYLFFLTDSKSVCVRAVRSWRGDRLCSWRSPVTGGGAIRHDRICVVRALTPSAHHREKATSSPLRLRLSWELANPHPPITTKMSHKLRTHNETTRRTRLISTHLQKKKFFFLTLLQALVLLLKLQLKSYKFLSKNLHIF